MKKEAPFSKQVIDEFREFNEDLKDMRIAAWRWLAAKYFGEGKMEVAKSLLANADDMIGGSLRDGGTVASPNAGDSTRRS